MGEPQYPVKSRQDRDGNELPYLDIAVNMNTTGEVLLRPTIAQLVVGPGPDQTGRITLARELLEERGHDPNVVVGSEVPLKW